MGCHLHISEICSQQDDVWVSLHTDRQTDREADRQTYRYKHTDIHTLDISIKHEQSPSTTGDSWAISGATIGYK